MGSLLELSMLAQIQDAHFPEPVREHRFYPGRKWQFDFAWVEQKLAVEVEGGEWVRGRHTRGAGYTRDCEKYNAAVLEGWRVLRFTGGMVENGSALNTLRRVFTE